MKILFITKPKLSVEPLGLMYLAATVKKGGHDVQFIASESDSFTQRVLEKFAPDYVGYSVMTGDQNYYRGVHELIVKPVSPAKSIVGGPHPTFCPEDFTWADHICRGEGEYWLLHLLNTGHDIIQERHCDCVVNAPDTLNLIPHPYRYLHHFTIRNFMATRGCPFNCKYCYNAKWREALGLDGQYKIRNRDPLDVIAEIGEVDPQFVYFQDDNFGNNISWLREFTDYYQGTPYHCHIHPAMLTEERVRLLSDSGCYSLRFAVESSDPDIRRMVLGRTMDNERFQAAARLLRSYGIRFMTQNMLGLPGTTINDDIWTLEFNRTLKPDYAWASIFQPYPGTELSEKCIKMGAWDGDVSKIGPSFFENTILNFLEEHKRDIYILHKQFAWCVEHDAAPDLRALRDPRYDNYWKGIYNKERKEGDKRLFGKWADTKYTK